MTNINNFTLNTQAVHDSRVIAKSCGDQFHQESERTRRKLRTYFYNESFDLVKSNQDNNFNGNKLTNLDSTTVR